MSSGIDPKWYAVSVNAASEESVVNAIWDECKKRGLEDLIEEILLPSEERAGVKKGKRIVEKKNFFPGYILIHARLTDELWGTIQGLQRVKSFLGGRIGKSMPTPMDQKEIEVILNKVQEDAVRPHTEINFEVGQSVKVCDGPFASFTGFVEEVDLDRGRLKVLVAIFGRETPLDLDFNQVEQV